MSEPVKRILLVEDDPARCRWFQNFFAGRSLDVTCSAAEGIEWLQEKDYQVILLDHDLLEEHYFSPTHDDERTGYGVARWLALHRESQPDATIIVHSLNYYGAQRMVEVLVSAGRDAQHIPFDLLQSGLKY